MQGFLFWLREGEKWEKVDSAATEGRLKASVEGEGSTILDVALDGAQVALTRPKEGEAAAPTNFRLCVTLADGTRHDFAVEGKSELVKWKKALKSEAGIEPEVTSSEVDAPSEQAPTEVLDQQQILVAPAEDENQTSNHGEELETKLEGPVPVDELENDDSKESVDLSKTCEIVVTFGDLEMHMTFRNLNDLEQLSVLELKGSICMKANEDPDNEELIRPSEIEVLLGKCVLREHWRGSDFDLVDGIQLTARRRNRNQEGLKEATDNVSTVPLKLSFVTQIKNQQFTVNLRDGEEPEDYVETLAERYSLSSENATALLMEIYKRLSKKFEMENDSLKTQVSEFKHRLKSTNVEFGKQSREYYESMLDRAADKVKTVEITNKNLSEELFQLRLVNAERLASED